MKSRAVDEVLSEQGVAYDRRAGTVLVSGEGGDLGRPNWTVPQVGHRNEVALLCVRGHLEAVPEETTIESLVDESSRAFDIVGPALLPPPTGVVSIP